MKFTLRLVEIREPHNKKLIIKRMVSDLSIDFKKAEYIIERLPQDLLHGATEEEVQQVTQDYERLGCRVTKLREKEEHHEVPPVSEPPKTEPAAGSGHLHIAATPATHFRLSVQAAPAPKKRFNRTAVLQITVLAFAVLVLVLVVALSGGRKTAPVNGQGTGDPRTEARDAAEKSGTETDQETEKSLARADSAQGTDEKVALLKEALAKSPENEEVKQKISSAMEQKAKEEYSADGRIRFYQMAIQFNPYNEGAWDGLIQAYEDNNMKDKADDAKKDKEARFREAHVKLNRLLNSFGNLEGVPRIEGGSLSFVYRSEKTDEADAESEMKKMAAKIRGVRNFQRISITAIVGGRRMIREF